MKLRKTSFLLTFSEIEGGNRMKEYNKDLDIVFSPMSDETMSWLDELFSTCKRFGVDYYNASEKDRVFVEAVARKNYGLKQASANGKAHEQGLKRSEVPPFLGLKRTDRSNEMPA